MPLRDLDDRLARDSYYAATAPPGDAHPALQGSTRCDVAVVGGGLAGLSAALDLAERGRDVLLLEAGTIGSGASGRNGGQAIHGLACDNAVIEAQLGLDDARRVWAMTIEALDLLRQRIARHAIDCDWRDGFLGLATRPRKGRALAAWADRIETVYGYALTRIAPADVGRWIASPRYHSGIHDPRSGHLHPLKYTRGLARAAGAAGVRLHEQTPVIGLAPPAAAGAPTLLRTAQGEVQAQQVLLAGNVALGDLAPALAPALATRIMPVGTYIACSEALDPALAERLIPSRSAVCDTNFVLDYFRTTADHRMLFGGRVSYSTRAPADLARAMRQRMRLAFPQLARARVDYAWGGFVDITMNRAPDFGRLPGLPSVYYLQGFSGHGLALTGLAGRLVAEAICGDASRFDVFARLRHRPFPGGRRLRTPALVLGMAWYRLRDMLG
ncbi:MAG: FAD-binding oxidoreductase [Burkholderiales bacterium]|nr:FAD-binding oxidoreductase [Burkholderiales bacterium]